MEKRSNKWKVGFWIYFAISIISILYLFVKNNSNEVTLAFTKMDKILIEQDFKMISEIVNKTDLSKTEILNEIVKDKLYKIENTENNKIEVGKVILNFEKEKLVKIEIKNSEVDLLLNGK
ncbi:hypothetical protein BXU11_15985 [Flavobacterium sp. LM5]|uniref:hypothetical protein n=1 Tax=Flavobacterium sp. LM5 TaxID=1938610 RepID=UPI0009936A87|nr:hypothetical protein [Flavobacterium sp. LM5]OOV25049.1 hypothetical protein BXU11_15985 [Flavobacterium sp. LM5]